MLTFSVLTKRQTSLTNLERKLVPRSDNRVCGAPWRDMTSLTNKSAATGASKLGTAKALGKRLRYAVKIMI